MTNKNPPLIAANRKALTVNEVLEVYGIGRTLLYKLLAKGVLKSAKLGGRRLILVESLDAHFSARAA